MFPEPVQSSCMPTTVRSFAKINIGLYIGARRPDGFHELRTVYQTIGVHDRITVSLGSGDGIELRCKVPGVPLDNTNTCWRVAERAMACLGQSGRVRIEIEKELPVQGGLGGASSNAVASLLALERELQHELPLPEKFRLAAEVGSDLPLFLIGGTVLGMGRGEEVYPLPELPPTTCVLAIPGIAVSTPQAFAGWDREHDPAKLTPSMPSDRINVFGSAVFLGLNGFLSRPDQAAGRLFSGVPAMEGRGRAETQLLDLVRTGMANDFEKVVFPQHPELAQVKRILEAEGASYASLSGSGSAIYGFFGSTKSAEKAAAALQAQGTRAHVTTTVTREQYWEQLLVAGPAR
ncbi:MAG TPA: 4-(cytidine 5'-diphospho)-2-C-methyl-D-erythritol kinase [Terriglobales bacterium]|jgi:4-diphosphocytidyl-2-C-methyl-D-erythritol kinase|nr:4-(cytidine 5'-diphospho)-2-C-methyl-D-erythritol kinase [Terriglobales bacterium]